jgi:hypothetical protein
MKQRIGREESKTKRQNLPVCFTETIEMDSIALRFAPQHKN